MYNRTIFYYLFTGISKVKYKQTNFKPMKNRILLYMVMVFTLTSCEALKDLFSVEVETTLETDIPVQVLASGTPLKSAGADVYTYSATGTLTLDENEDLEEYLDVIESITIESVEITIQGLSRDQVIESLVLSVEGIGTLVELTNITSSSGTFTPDISSTLLDQVCTTLETEKQITATVTGTSNYAPLQFTIQLAADVVVKAGLF